MINFANKQKYRVSMSSESNIKVFIILRFRNFFDLFELAKGLLLDIETY